MKKTEQLIKELQMLIDKPEMNDIIAEKMTDMWRDAKSEENMEWVSRQDKYWENFKKWMSPEDFDEMAKTHNFVSTNDYGDDEMCFRCELDLNSFEREPQYCEKQTRKIL